MVNGFRHGFDLGYDGPKIRRSTAANLPITVGSKIEMWNKLMKKVMLKRVAGPYDSIPYDNYIQSPIGLVPKAGGEQTRLIFHLSYDFGPEEKDKSVNYHTPAKICMVKYYDLDHAVQAINKLRTVGEQVRKQQGRHQDFRPVIVYQSKTDIKSAFRLAPLKKSCWAWLIMAAQNPFTGKRQYFVDKCLPFGASISCAIFQSISDALKHIAQYRTKADITNYLDDFHFIALTIARCNFILQQFLTICDDIGFPVVHDKTEWASELLTFLGILLDGRFFRLGLSLEKIDKAKCLLWKMIDKRKATVKELQTLCGYLNFLGKAVVPGRMFTRHMYSKYAKIVNPKHDQRYDAQQLCLSKSYTPKQYHHIKLDQEFKLDCKVWLQFLAGDELSHVVSRPMVDLDTVTYAQDIKFYSDASVGVDKGYGCILGNNWLFGRWPAGFIKNQKPSIEYLELFALVAGLLTWDFEDCLQNCRVILHCDNQAVCAMVNNLTSSCKNCMTLLRIMVLNGLQHDRRVFVRYITSKDNFLSDALSRQDLVRFRRLGGNKMNEYPDSITETL